MNPVDYATLLEAFDRGSPLAVALVLSVTGSTPGRPGMRALIDPTGKIQGTIGGGAMEAAVQRQATDSLNTGHAALVDFVMEGSAAGDPTPICGGRMRILVDPNPTRHRAAFSAARAAQQRRDRGVLLTFLVGATRPAVETIWRPELSVREHAEFPGVQAIMDALEAGELRFLERLEVGHGRSLAVLVEPVIPPPLLVIFGAGHVGQALAWQAHQVGFEVAVVDDRPEFIEAARFPAGATLLCTDAAGARNQFPMTLDSYVVLVGRGYQQDLQALSACLDQPVRYLGMIGSRRKLALVRRDLLAAGRATPAQLERIHAPVGLEIGAVTVAEIAVSIAAELIAVRRQPLRYP